jgi:hypothetical protein
MAKTTKASRYATREGESRIDYLKRAAKWCRTKYREARQTESCHCSHTASDVMYAAERLFTDLKSFGVEGFIQCGGVSYLNIWDPYDLTIVFLSKSERFQVTSWGDIVERCSDED